MSVPVYNHTYLQALSVHMSIFVVFVSIVTSVVGNHVYRPSYKQRAPQLLSERPSAGGLSPIRKLHSEREAFDSHIKKILQRGSSNPLLK